MKKLYLAWQDAIERSWYPVGCLSFDNQIYRFVYTKGARAAPNFVPFGRMTDLNIEYQSNELFPIFANRLMSKSRPEYKDYLQWLNLKDRGDVSFVILSITEGKRGTDSLEVFPCPEPNSAGKYEVRFLNHGLKYLSEHSTNRVNSLSPGEQLFLMHDLQNSYDPYALAIRCDDPTAIIGYCPRYLTRDLHELLKHNPSSVKVTVDQVNPNAPIKLRLICKVQSDWPKGFLPCSDTLYQPIAGERSCSIST
ncbi:MAG: HIRAN domain protein [Syntrophorhabdus sp. PtaU1.Bin050]|nr:MAG: HIRAN domain protein [Syntrophorhabdus sp. PtaU1.Bin050]